MFKWRSHLRCYIMYIYISALLILRILSIGPSGFGWNKCIIGFHAYTAPIQLAVMRFYSQSIFRLEISLIRFQICLGQHTKNVYVWYVNNFEFNPCNRKKSSKSIWWMRNAVCILCVPWYINYQLISSFIYLETRMIHDRWMLSQKTCVSWCIPRDSN